MDVERAGETFRERIGAVLRQPRRPVRQPITLVLRWQDAWDLAPAVMGTLGRILQPIDVSDSPIGLQSP